MRWNLVILGSFALLLVALAGCAGNNALAGKASSFGNNKELSFPYKLNTDFITRMFATDVVLIFDPLCGNGILDKGEECDDGNSDDNIDGAGCSASCICPTPIRRINAPGEPLCGSCGDGTIALGEECDDGNVVDDDGCSAICTIEHSFTIHVSFPTECGNSILERGEECDDGNAIDNDGCSTCLLDPPPVCGNGIIEVGEDCDSGLMCTGECTFREPVECYECVAEECVGFSVLGESCPPGSTDIASCSAVCGVPEPDDGIVDVVPEPEDVALCEEPDPRNLPPGTRFRDLESGTRHVSSCEPVGSENCRGRECSRIAVCHPDGSTTVSVIPCPEPEETCVDAEGVCIGDPIWRPQCFDSDEGFSPSTYGEIIQIGPDGAMSPQRDFCVEEIYIYEYFCIGGSIGRSQTLNCQDLDGYCDAGRCVPGETSCTETDGGNDPLTPGVRTIHTPIGNYDRPDLCNIFQTDLAELFCSGNRPSSELIPCSSPALCDADVCHCEERAEGALCVPGEPPVILCDDGDGGEDIFTHSSAGFRRGGGFVGSTDSCASSTSVNEGICVTEHEHDLVELPCPDGYNCFGGACVEEVTCTREPAGDAGGYVTDRDGVEWLDYCSDANTLEVYGCREDRTAYVVGSTPCPAGCDMGRGRCI